MDLNEQAEQAVSAARELFPIDANGEILAFARQVWFLGYEAGMDATNAKVNAMFDQWQAAQS